MHIGIINGPNLNLTGVREQNLYGDRNFDQIILDLKESFTTETIDYFQSNIEGELINKLHEWGFKFDGIILNAGAYTHTSVALGDAVKAIKTPVIEVHMSNVMDRETFRHISYISAHASGVISGFGEKSYRLAIMAFTNGPAAAR